MDSLDFLIKENIMLPLVGSNPALKITIVLYPALYQLDHMAFDNLKLSFEILA